MDQLEVCCDVVLVVKWFRAICLFKQLEHELKFRQINKVSIKDIHKSAVKISPTCSHSNAQIVYSNFAGWWDMYPDFCVLYRDADKSLTRPTSRSILYDG